MIEPSLTNIAWYIAGVAVGVLCSYLAVSSQNEK